MWYWLLKYVLIGPLLRLLGRPKVEGLRHVPADGPVIIAANHLAAIDSLYLALVLPRRITFIAKQEYFTASGWRGRCHRWVMTATGQVRVDRSGGSAAADALAAAERILESGGIWGIHPEGTRSPDGRIYRGRTGVIRVAMRTGAPVVPVALSGTDRVNPRGRRFLRFARVRISFGRPRYFPPADRPAVRAATDALMLDLAARSGRRYVNRYAATFGERR
ncbi:1-acyl-sn-glycerol-3-phosphate acyltransferase [Nocardia sp. CDC159]|uniref:1-acyl-sn-glycerol-3-phosphate acyltransferase n=1 Tax=Nocardia pulmonis TaxID=2951408 RepID=A0A9X2EA88_9NOCA|nr:MULTISPECIES: lysophospholipid acyltransferase family protein [Nocardia]MCM6777192.1 1-acyl-sn-glycerol-3-phosphate acyltransferase [Nocardia pulmonis]MCM6790077.1 1-acyl-sn-glycerol-3-phosphate acyltransferase [Nocardia sp. CDC159]